MGASRGKNGGFLAGGNNYTIEVQASIGTTPVGFKVPSNAVYARVHGSADFKLFGPPSTEAPASTKFITVPSGVANGYEVPVEFAAQKNAAGGSVKVYVAAPSSTFDVTIVWEIDGEEV